MRPRLPGPLMALSIPGHYYDKEKNRYFKILPGHQAPGGSLHSYSADAVRRRIRDEVEVADKCLDAKTKIKSPLPRRHRRALVDLSGARGHRETLQMLWSGMTPHYTLHASISSRFEPGQGIDEVCPIDVCGETIGLLRAESKWLTFGTFDCRLEGMTKFDTHSCVPLGSQVSHLSTEGQSVLATTIGEPPRGASARLFRIAFPGDSADGGSIDDVPTLILTTQWAPAMTTLWSAAMQSRQIALGAEKKVFYIQDSGVERVQGYNQETKLQVLRTESDPLSLQFSKDGHQLLSGLRDGRVRMWDVRSDHDSYWVRQEEKDYHCGDVIRAPASVVDMRIVKEWYLVCSLINGVIAMYDLRFCPKPSASRGYARSNVKEDHHPSHGSSKRKMTNAALTFSGHRNDYMISLGFDIDPSEQFMAVAGDDHIVRLWSLGDSEPLVPAESASSTLLTTKFEDPVRALRFSDHPQDDSIRRHFHPDDMSRCNDALTTYNAEHWLAHAGHRSTVGIGNRLGLWVGSGSEASWYAPGSAQLQS